MIEWVGDCLSKRVIECHQLIGLLSHDVVRSEAAAVAPDAAFGAAPSLMLSCAMRWRQHLSTSVTVNVSALSVLLTFLLVQPAVGLTAGASHPRCLFALRLNVEMLCTGQ